MSVPQKFISSFNRMKDLRTLMGAAMLIALNVILDMAGTLYVTNELRIGFGFLTAALCGALYGPAVAGFSGALTDILGFLIRPAGPYFPGFTLTAILGGVIYGLILYGKKPTVLRCFAAKGLINLILNVGLNTVWHTLLYGKAMEVLIPARFIKNLGMWPIESIMLLLVLNAVEQILVRSGFWKPES